jgi:plastocyanin
MYKVIAGLLCVLALAPTAQAQTSPPPPEHRADPSLTTYVERSGPIKIGPYATFKHSVEVKAPPVAGAIVGMDVRLVDARGQVIPQWITMLHHVVFTNGGPDDRRRDPGCPAKATRERFYGSSEELRALTLPPGYGYPTDPKDVWRTSLMVMHHRSGTQEFFMEYRVTVDPRPLTPVKPYWLSVIPCSPDPQWSVPGRGSKEHRRSREFRMPEAGRIVAVGGHLHGGAKELILSQPQCGHRTLVSSKPAYAPADDNLYKVRPLLHEPDPKSISWWQSATGIAIPKNGRLKVTASYDNTLPHTRVMGIDHVYLAPIDAPPAACGPLPPDAQILGPEFANARLEPPRINLTLARVGNDGKARPTTSAFGAPRTVEKPTVKVRVHDFKFSLPNLTIDRGTVVRWRFPDSEQHDVTLARGPIGFGSPWLNDDRQYGRRFTEPGRYLLMCSLHSAYMSQVITVKR